MWTRALCLAAGLVGCMPVDHTETLVSDHQLPEVSDPLGVAVNQCAQQQGLSGVVTVRLSIDPDGGAGTISADQGGSELVRCAGQALGATRFPRPDRGRTFVVPIAVGT
ncbi:MAG: hypothetical protein ACM31C_24440 [Acidobacteriota bacterium]